MHEPGGYDSLGFNKSWWEALSKSDQALITACAHTECDVMMAEYNANNGTYLRKLIDEHGVQLREFNDDVYDAFGRASAEVYEGVRAHSDLANRIHESFAKARADVGGWMKLSEGPYYAQRNRVLGL